MDIVTLNIFILVPVLMLSRVTHSQVSLCAIDKFSGAIWNPLEAEDVIIYLLEDMSWFVYNLRLLSAFYLGHCLVIQVGVELLIIWVSHFIKSGTHGSVDVPNHQTRFILTLQSH